MDPWGVLIPQSTIGPQVPERADAARNRARLLEVAGRIVDREGPDGLTMDRLAAESGVGKGTIFRRFGSRAGVFQALVDANEREFQARFLSGPPPVGPGAPPLERLVAFGRARIETVSRQRALMAAAERPVTERTEVPARKLVELHIATLLREAEVQADIPILTFNLLAVLEAVLLLPDDEHLDHAVPRLAAGWEELVRRLA
ncbi:MAG: TetR/AcrR family transcriptional regulator [Herbiconiux sp.]|uniref:TetR/AcrR family transcriptional regulator n=1 Tax=Herbiconiux sp. TaxID=1871186 RepID=UPI0012037678|nr:TetR/AcrR family transcriptional regulator [Herbiconiux sp.]TAJ48446.1 MAG: TetR/AcrR family transcriptional regulator [Herbiconiux sp.]